MPGSPARIRRFFFCLAAAFSLVAAGLAGISITSGHGRGAGPALSGGRVTSMAALAPQLLAKPGGDPVTGAAAKQPACTPAELPAAGVTMAAPGRAVTVAHDGASVRIGPGAVRGATRITAVSLCATSLAPMDQGMSNVTAGPRRGYRFLPHMTFAAKLRITLPYDPALIPAGESAQDVKTFYYDVKLGKWQALPLVSVDQSAHTVTSITTHFTDFVDATITVPDSPGVLNDNPTSIKDIKAADPSAGLALIAPPTATDDGSAHLSYPIQLPAGRHDQTPSLSLNYDSTADNGSAGPADGWLGEGWNLALPTVTVNTQWGVPRYDPAHETETYMLGAQELAPVANRDPAVPRTPDKVFHMRIEGAFLKIVRHGDDPKTYWWAFQETALYLYGHATVGFAYPENTERMNSLMRKEFYGGSGDVIPDAMGGVVVNNTEGQLLAAYPRSLFIEIKAVNAPSDTYFGYEFGSPLGRENGQLAGLMEIAGFSPAGMSQLLAPPGTKAPAMILFLTTSNTDIHDDLLKLATAANVAVWQAKAYAVQDPITQKWEIGFYPAELLNPDIAKEYAAQGTKLNNPLPNGTGLAIGLGRTINATPAVINPDPTFVP